MTPGAFDPLPPRPTLSPEESIEAARRFLDTMSTRRTVRDFSNRPVSRQLLETCLRAAVTAPSGANLQPWHFVLVGDAATKSRLRAAAEEEERAFYSKRATEEWREALAPLGTDEHKPFLETAPWLIAIFVQKHGYFPDGSIRKHYYPVESVGLATGFLIAALHHAGLATLTHTPSPMGFLNEILGRPANEKPFLLLVVGHPAPEARVPRITKKGWGEIVTVRE